MELISVRSKLSGAIFLVLISLIGSQEIIFQLKDRQFQEILFSGDETVAIICKITDLQTAEINITNASGDTVAASNGENNCVEFVIPQIVSTENLNYTCAVSYSSGGNVPAVTETKTLTLNVSKRDQFCFRNGTINQPYNVRDVLLLSCYCRVTASCIWTENAVGSMLGRQITPIEQREYNNKQISRIIVGPLNASSIMSLRWDCSQGPTIEERCSIGPVDDSTNDFILSPIPSSESSIECPLPEMSTEIAETYSSTGNTSLTTVALKTASSTIEPTLGVVSSSTEESSSDKTNQTTEVTPTALNHTTEESRSGAVDTIVPSTDEFPILIVVVAAAVGVFILLVLFLICIWVCRKRKRKDPKTATEEHEIGDKNQNDQDSENKSNHVSDAPVVIQETHVSDEDVDSTNTTDKNDIEQNDETPASVPVTNDEYDHESEDEDEDQFQTAETTDYSTLTAFLKNSTQPDLAEPLGLAADINELDNSGDEQT